MAKMVGYRCVDCGKEDEELFLTDTDEKPEFLDRLCECGGKLQKWNVKKNEQSWRYNDLGGI